MPNEKLPRRTDSERRQRSCDEPKRNATDKLRQSANKRKLETAKRRSVTRPRKKNERRERPRKRRYEKGRRRKIRSEGRKRSSCATTKWHLRDRKKMAKLRIKLPDDIQSPYRQDFIRQLNQPRLNHHISRWLRRSCLLRSPLPVLVIVRHLSRVNSLTAPPRILNKHIRKLLGNPYHHQHRLCRRHPMCSTYLRRLTDNRRFYTILNRLHRYHHSTFKVEGVSTTSA